MAAIVLGQRLSPVLNLLVSGVADLRALGFANAVTCGLTAAVLEFLPALGMGMLLASFVIQGERERPGRSNQRPADWLHQTLKKHKQREVPQRNEVAGGTPATAGGTPALPGTSAALVAYNAFLFGSLIGLLTASRWLIPNMGTLPIVAISLILLTAILALVTLPQIIDQPSTIIPMALAGILIYSLGTGLGDAYLYGHRQTGNGPPNVEYFRVGATGDVRVSQHEGFRSLEFNGVPIAGTGADLTSEMGLAYFPRLLRPNASKVLVIGLGSGAACGASLLFPQTQLICAESEPAIVSAINLFTNVNHLTADSISPMSLRSFFRGFEKSPPTAAGTAASRPSLPSVKPAFVSLVTEDGREALNNLKQKQELILVNYGDARLPDAARFLSKQFYALAKSRLAPGGILAHRLKVDSFTTAGLALIARTILVFFHHSGLVRISDTDAILLASDSSLVESPKAVQAAQSLLESQNPIQSDIKEIFDTAKVPAVLVTHLWLNEEGLRRLGKRDFETSLVTDWNPGIESFKDQNVMDEADNGRLVIQRILSSATIDGFEQNFIRCGCTNGDALLCHEIATIFSVHDQPGLALKTMDWGLRLAPKQADLLAERLIWHMEEDQNVIKHALNPIEKGSVDVANRLGIALWERKQYSNAILVFEQAIKFNPLSATLWCNLAVNYQAAGQTNRAKECLIRAGALDPVNEFVKKTAKEFPNSDL